MKTTNLKCSKVIAGLGVKVESEKYHITTEKDKSILITCKSDCGFYGDSLWNKRIPTYSFQELIDILPEIGKKLGLGNHIEERVHLLAHVLLDEYQKDGDMSGVSLSIIRLIEHGK